MFLKHTFCTQPFSFPLKFPFAKGLGMYQRHGRDITLGHETRRIKDTSINGEGKKRCSNALCRTSLERQATTSHQIKSFAYGNFYYSSYQTDRGKKKKTAFRFSQEKNDFQIMTFESSGEGMTYLQ